MHVQVFTGACLSSSKSVSWDCLNGSVQESYCIPIWLSILRQIDAVHDSPLTRNIFLKELSPAFFSPTHALCHLLRQRVRHGNSSRCLDGLSKDSRHLPQLTIHYLKVLHTHLWGEADSVSQLTLLVYQTTTARQYCVRTFIIFRKNRVRGASQTRID